MTDLHGCYLNPVIKFPWPGSFCDHMTELLALGNMASFTAICNVCKVTWSCFISHHLHPGFSKTVPVVGNHSFALWPQLFCFTTAAATLQPLLSLNDCCKKKILRPSWITAIMGWLSLELSVPLNYWDLVKSDSQLQVRGINWLPTAVSAKVINFFHA